MELCTFVVESEAAIVNTATVRHREISSRWPHWKLGSDYDMDQCQDFGRCCPPPRTCRPPPTTWHPAPATHHLAPATRHPPPTTRHPPPTNSHPPPAICLPPPSSCLLPPPPASCLPHPTSRLPPPTSRLPPPATFRLLPPSASCHLPPSSWRRQLNKSGCARWRLGRFMFINQQNAGYEPNCGNSSIYITSSCLHLDSLFLPYWTHRQQLNTLPASWTILTSHDLHKTMPLVPKHTQ